MTSELDFAWRIRNDDGRNTRIDPAWPAQARGGRDQLDHRAPDWRSDHGERDRRTEPPGCDPTGLGRRSNERLVSAHGGRIAPAFRAGILESGVARAAAVCAVPGLVGAAGDRAEDQERAVDRSGGNPGDA